MLANKKERLFEAVLKNDIETVKEKFFASPKRYKYYTEALWIAISHNNWAIIDIFAKSGCDLSVKNKIGMTLLSHACMKENARLVKLLLENGVDVNQLNDDQTTALYWSIRQGGLLNCTNLISHGADVNRANDDGCTPLMQASMYGVHSVLLCLIQNQANLNAKDKNGKTAMMYAAERNNCVAIDEICKAGGNIEIRDNSGMTALCYAAKSYYGATNELVFHGAELDVKTKDGYTPYLLAASNGNLEVVKFLADKGCDIYAKTHTLRTALALAKEEGVEDCIEFITALDEQRNLDGMIAGSDKPADDLAF